MMEPRPRLSTITVLLSLNFFCLLPAIISSYSFLPTASHRNVLLVKQQFRIDVAIDPSSSNQYQQRREQKDDEQQFSMKVSRGKSKINKSNTLETVNRARKNLAGKPGTKHYMDPCKLFIGNLPYDATVDDVTDFLKDHLSTLHDVRSIKIVTDWKTGKSKGFGFVQFMDPMFATTAMSIVKGKKLKGRVIRLDQGRKKDDLDNREMFVKKRSRDKGRLDEEGRVIDGVLDTVEGIDDAGVSVEIAADGSKEEAVYTLDDFDDEDDALFDDDDDDEFDDDAEFDGIFEQIYGPNKWEDLDEEETKNMNRAQKREAAKRRKRKKLPHKGFEAAPKTKLTKPK